MRIQQIIWLIIAPALGGALGVGILWAPEASAVWLGKLLPPCMFHRLTGLNCPGCGGTRAVQALLRGDWYAAWHFNMFLWISVALLAEEYVRYGLILLRGEEHISSTHAYTALLKLYAFATLAWFILRNIVHI